MDRIERAALVIGPHFDAVRDWFCAFEVAPGETLARLRKVKLTIDPTVHDSPRHYARCREDGLEIQLAPEAEELEIETLVPLISHEMGHACDFQYPAMWIGERGAQARWIGAQDNKQGRKLQRLWSERSPDVVEWTADSIAHCVIGKAVRYCGPDKVQCWSPSGVERPAGLR